MKLNMVASPSLSKLNDRKPVLFAYFKQNRIYSLSEALTYVDLNLFIVTLTIRRRVERTGKSRSNILVPLPSQRDFRTGTGQTGKIVFLFLGSGDSRLENVAKY